MNTNSSTLQLVKLVENEKPLILQSDWIRLALACVLRSNLQRSYASLDDVQKTLNHIIENERQQDSIDMDFHFTTARNA